MKILNPVQSMGCVLRIHHSQHLLVLLWCNTNQMRQQRITLYGKGQKELSTRVQPPTLTGATCKIAIVKSLSAPYASTIIYRGMGELTHKKTRTLCELAHPMIRCPNYGGKLNQAQYIFSHYGRSKWNVCTAHAQLNFTRALWHPRAVPYLTSIRNSTVVGATEISWRTAARDI